MADLHSVLAGRVPGLVMELGVCTGNTMSNICEAVKPQTVYGFDWFHGLPESWGDDPPGLFDVKGVVPRVPPNGEIIVGRVEDTVPHFFGVHTEPVSFVHFDLDLYGPTKLCLECIRFQPGSILAFDEITNDHRNTEHEQRAFWEWISGTDWRLTFLGQFHLASWVIQLR